VLTSLDRRAARDALSEYYTSIGGKPMLVVGAPRASASQALKSVTIDQSGPSIKKSGTHELNLNRRRKLDMEDTHHPNELNLNRRRKLDIQDAQHTHELNLNKRRKLDMEDAHRTHHSAISYNPDSYEIVPHRPRETPKPREPHVVRSLSTLLEAANHIEQLKRDLLNSFLTRVNIAPSSTMFFHSTPPPCLAKLYRTAQSHDGSRLLYPRAVGQLNHKIVCERLVDSILHDFTSTTRLNPNVFSETDPRHKIRLEQCELLGIVIPKLLAGERRACVASEVFMKERVRPAAILKAWDAWVVLVPHLVFLIKQGNSTWEVCQEGFEAGLEKIIEEMLLLETRKSVAEESNET